MELQDFNVQCRIAQSAIDELGPVQLPIEQERLRRLIPELPEQERAWATAYIDEDLPMSAAESAPPTALMTEADDIRRTSLAFRGTRAEMKLRFQDARRQIEEIAGRAGDQSEAGRIRWMTRSFDGLEEALDDPQWQFPADEPEAEPRDVPRG